MTQPRATVPLAHETLDFDALCRPDGETPGDAAPRLPALACGERQRVLCPGVGSAGQDTERGLARLDLLARETPRRDWLLLTMDAGRLHSLLPPSWAASLPPNFWVGVRASNQAETDARLPGLLALPASVRFLWANPLTGPIDLSPYLPGADVRKCGCPCHDDPGICHVKPCCYDGYIRTPHPPDLHWVVAGGDERADTPPVNPYQVRDLHRQCYEAAVTFYFTSWGRWAPHVGFTLRRKIRFAGSHAGEFTDMARLRPGQVETYFAPFYEREVPVLPHPPPQEIRP